MSGVCLSIVLIACLFNEEATGLPWLPVPRDTKEATAKTCCIEAFAANLWSAGKSLVSTEMSTGIE